MRRRHALLISLLAGAAVIAVTVGVVRAAGLNDGPSSAAASLGTNGALPGGSELRSSVANGTPSTTLDDDLRSRDRDDDHWDDERHDDDHWDDDGHDDDDDHHDDEHD